MNTATNLTETQQMVALWKEKNINRCEMDFACGGDQMNDTEFKFFDNDNNQVENDILEDFFENQVYNEVEFYVNSDGHYQGEAGVVTIELIEDGEDDEDEPYFSYSKSAESEWNESFTEVGWMEVSEAEAKFIKANVHSIVGGEDGETINYKRDIILNDEEEEMMNKLEERLRDFAVDYEIQNAEGEENEWFTYTTDTGEADSDIDVVYDVDNPTIIQDGKLAVVINKSYTIWKED